LKHALRVRLYTLWNVKKPTVISPHGIGWNFSSSSEVNTDEGPVREKIGSDEIRRE